MNRKTFNPKIAFRFIENLWQKRDPRHSETRLKQIYLGKSVPHSFTEMMFCKSLTAYHLIEDGSPLDKRKLKDLLCLFNPNAKKRDFSNPEIDGLIDEIKDMDPFGVSMMESFARIYRDAILIPQFEGAEIEMAKLLANCRLIEEGVFPIIMYSYSCNSMANIARHSGDPGEIMKTLNHLYERTAAYNLVHPIIPVEEIIETLNESKAELGRRFGITHLYLFGSYARGEQSVYSDVDLLAYIKKQNRAMPNLKTEAKKYLKFSLGIDVDLMIDDPSYDKAQMPLDIGNEKKQIF